MWVLHPEIGLIIQEAWSRGFTLSTRLKNNKMTLKEYNKLSFGNIHTKIEELKQFIKILQDSPPNSLNLSIEEALHRNLDELLKFEEIH